MSTAHYGRAVPLALRRFARLRCKQQGPPGAPPLGELELPSGLPPGIHVVLLMRRRRHIEHADSWLGVREAWERVLAERGLRQEGELRLYICCLLPRFWPLRPFWYWRLRQWTRLLEEEGLSDAKPDGGPAAVHLLTNTTWSRTGFYDQMHLHDDGRAYAMVLRNDGEILWGSHDAFKEHLQEKAMVTVVHRECHYRENEQQNLLPGPPAGALEAPTGPAEGGAITAESGGTVDNQVGGQPDGEPTGPPPGGGPEAKSAGG
mmetsp:Transcript_94124/g.280897  ORF Transcript_94124/g.280897 Transcript_94124/m.280897 type:complete len:261 (+) Transcript_94124:69-851(+)